MADRTIKPDDGNDLVLQNNHGNGKIEINEDDTVKITGNVGIGILPVEEVHITGDDPTLLIEHTASSYGESNLKLGNDSGTNASQIQYDSAQASLYITNKYPISAGQYGRIFFQQNVGGSETDVLTIDNRNVSINDGNLVIGTAGHGIDFAAQTTSSASGTTPSTGADEVLDHYEVGTFEPSVSLSTVGDSTCTEKSGTYCRIGDFVSVHGRCRFNKGSSGAGTLSSITGLPFTSFTLTGYQSAGSSASIGGGATHYIEKLRLDSGTNIVSFSLYPLSSSTSGVAFSPSNMASSFYIRFSLQYRCAA